MPPLVHGENALIVSERYDLFSLGLAILPTGSRPSALSWRSQI